MIFLLSPHPDDIALSIGGLVDIYAQQGVECCLVNFFTESDYCLPSFQKVDITKQRAEEDSKFAKLFNLKRINFSLPDSSILEHTAQSEKLCCPNDIRKSDLKRKLLYSINQFNPKKIFCPLGIGGHIDHRMVKEVVLDINDVTDKLYFYEDLPYATNYSDQDIKDIIKHTTPLKLTPSLIDITSSWSKKEMGILFYRSQIPYNIVLSIKEYASLLKHTGLFERIWQPEKASK